VAAQLVGASIGWILHAVLSPQSPSSQDMP
jgi:hypothetical protein